MTSATLPTSCEAGDLSGQVPAAMSSSRMQTCASTSLAAAAGKRERRLSDRAQHSSKAVAEVESLPPVPAPSARLASQICIEITSSSKHCQHCRTQHIHRKPEASAAGFMTARTAESNKLIYGVHAATLEEFKSDLLSLHRHRVALLSFPDSKSSEASRSMLWKL